MTTEEQAEAVIDGLSGSVTLTWTETERLPFWRTRLTTKSLVLIKDQVDYMIRSARQGVGLVSGYKTASSAEIVGLSDKKRHCDLPMVVVEASNDPVARGFKGRHAWTRWYCSSCAKEDYEP